jgi:hypothetical protein
MQDDVYEFILDSGTLKHFTNVTAGIANNSSTTYQVFQSAKSAKREMEYAAQEIDEIKLSTILPDILKDSITHSLSTISSSYLTMSEAFDLAMDLAKNPTDQSYAEAYGSEMEQATQMYVEALTEILKIHGRFIITKKQTSKLKHKSKSK